MSESRKPALKRPPGYRDPRAPIHTAPRPQFQKQPLPPSFQPKRKRRGCCRTCCCFLCIFLLVFILLLAAAGGLFYLFFDPKPPTYSLQSIQFSRFNVSDTPDGTYLNSVTAVRFQVKNPNRNKITFYYGETEFRMTVDDQVGLGSATIPGFTQPRQNITMLRFVLRENHVLIDDADGSKLKDQFSSKSMLVRVEIRTRFGFGVENWELGKFAVNVLCRNVSLKQLNAGTTPKCTVNLFKWISLTT